MFIMTQNKKQQVIHLRIVCICVVCAQSEYIGRYWPKSSLQLGCLRRVLVGKSDTNLRVVVYMSPVNRASPGHEIISSFAREDLN